MPGRGKMQTHASPVADPGPGSGPTAGISGDRAPELQSGNAEVGSPSATECHDIFLNERCCWRNVPAPVWDYTIGGYQVLKKWLSYREKPLLARGLTPDEVRHFTDTARRLAALLALHPALDANYRATASVATEG